MDIILSKYAVLEWLLRRPVTIVKDTERLMIQCVYDREPGRSRVASYIFYTRAQTYDKRGDERLRPECLQFADYLEVV